MKMSCGMQKRKDISMLVRAFVTAFLTQMWLCTHWKECNMKVHFWVDNQGVLLVTQPLLEMSLIGNSVAMPFILRLRIQQATLSVWGQSYLIYPKVWAETSTGKNSWKSLMLGRLYLELTEACLGQVIIMITASQFPLHSHLSHIHASQGNWMFRISSKGIVWLICSKNFLLMCMKASI